MRHIEIDMLKVAKEVTGKEVTQHEVMELAAGLTLHRFDRDSLQILVDAGGEFTAIKDPDTSIGTILRKGHLSEFVQ